MLYEWLFLLTCLASWYFMGISKNRFISGGISILPSTILYVLACFNYYNTTKDVIIPALLCIVLLSMLLFNSLLLKYLVKTQKVLANVLLALTIIVTMLVYFSIICGLRL